MTTSSTRTRIDRTWLTGYGAEALAAELDAGTDFETFFAEAPRMNPARAAITGVGYHGRGLSRAWSAASGAER